MRARWLLVLVTAPALDENNQTGRPRRRERRRQRISVV